MQTLSTIKKLSTFAMLALGLSVAGCNNMTTVPTPDTNPIHQPASQHPTANLAGNATQCPPFNPEMNMCTMQYDPVCVKEKTADGKFVYRTAGNACSACGRPEAISYVEGECP